MVTTRNTERPLSARSVVASTLLGMRPPRLPTAILVRSGELFGIADGTTRVALSRMVAAGELRPDGDGYRLDGSLLVRQARQDVSRRGVAGESPWDRSWRIEIVAPVARDAPERTQLRSAAAAVRLAEVREGVWTRPANLRPDALAEAEAVIAAQCQRFTGQPDGPSGATGADLAATLWDLPGWATEATGLRRRLAAVVDQLEAGDLAALAPGFVLSAAVLRHLQADPLLPADLLPAIWPGDALRADYDRYDTAFKSVWRTWYRAQR